MSVNRITYIYSSNSDSNKWSRHEFPINLWNRVESVRNPNACAQRTQFVIIICYFGISNKNAYRVVNISTPLNAHILLVVFFSRIVRSVLLVNKSPGSIFKLNNRNQNKTFWAKRQHLFDRIMIAIRYDVMRCKRLEFHSYTILWTVGSIGIAVFFLLPHAWQCSSVHKRMENFESRHCYYFKITCHSICDVCDILCTSTTH